MVKKGVTFNGGNQLIAAANRNVSASTGYVNLLMSTITTQMADSQSPIEQTQSDKPKSAQIYEDLAKMYTDDEFLDCTIAVPKENREFKVDICFQSKFFLKSRFAGFAVFSLGSIARLSPNVRRRHGGDEKQARCYQGLRRRYR